MKKKPIRAKIKSTLQKKSRQLRPDKNKYVRTALTVFVVCLIVLAAGAVIAKVARPYVICYGESKETTKIRQQIAQAEAEKRTLSNQIKYLTDPKSKDKALEIEARKLGWVKDGEIALVVEPPSKPQADKSPNAHSAKTFWQTAGREILGLFVGK